MVFGRPKRVGPNAFKYLLEERVRHHPLRQEFGKEWAPLVETIEYLFETARATLNANSTRAWDAFSPAVKEQLRAGPARPAADRSIAVETREYLVQRWKRAAQGAFIQARFAGEGCALHVLAWESECRHQRMTDRIRLEAFIKGLVVSSCRAFVSTIDTRTPPPEDPRRFEWAAARPIYSPRFKAKMEGIRDRLLRTGGKPMPIHAVIVDEAGCVPDFALCQLLVDAPQSLLLVGDCNQLAPFSHMEQHRAKEPLYSVMERLERVGFDPAFLAEQ